MAADLLLRVRRPAVKAARDQSDGGVETGPSAVFAGDSLAGRVALVSEGGTNLGKAAAAELARCGAAVVIASRREEPLRTASQDVGERCTWVGEISAKPTTPTQLVRRHGRLGALLSSA